MNSWVNVSETHSYQYFARCFPRKNRNEAPSSTTKENENTYKLEYWLRHERRLSKGQWKVVQVLLFPISASLKACSLKKRIEMWRNSEVN